MKKISWYVYPGLKKNVLNTLKIGRPVVTGKCEKIREEVCKIYGVDPVILKGKRRKREHVEARQMIMFLTIGLKTYKQIGKDFNRDHTTVIHAKQTIENLMDAYPVIKSRVQYVKNVVGL